MKKLFWHTRCAFYCMKFGYINWRRPFDYRSLANFMETDYRLEGESPREAVLTDLSYA